MKKSSKSDELSFLGQMVISLEEAEVKLEEAYKKKKPEQFRSIKEFILKLNKKISEAIK